MHEAEKLCFIAIDQIIASEGKEMIKWKRKHNNVHFILEAKKNEIASL